MKINNNEILSKQPNSDMLILGRESRGYTQSQLAKKLGTIKQSQLSKMESGIQNISMDNLEIIAAALDYPVDFFFQNEPLHSPGISWLFRKNASLTAKTLNKVQAITAIKDIQIKKLLNSIDISHLPMPQYSTEEYTPELIAKMVRTLWKVPKGPIKNVFEIIENAGGIIVPIDFETIKIDAVSRYAVAETPLFFVDLSKPMDRIRFSLCNELGHVIMHMHQIPSSEIEFEANSFAAEFLMPKEDIKHDLVEISTKNLHLLKLKWKTSMSSIIYRAKELGIISESKAQSFYVHLSKKGYRTREPEQLDPPREIPTLLNELLKTHQNELNYSNEELSRLLLVNERDLDDMLPSSRPKLRIIK